LHVPIEKTPKNCTVLQGGVKFLCIFFAPPEMLPFHVLADCCKRLTPLLAVPAALLLVQGQAKAVLTYNIFESAGAVTVQTSGSLDLTGATSVPESMCGFDGAIASPLAIICTGPDIGPIPAYSISGPTSFIGTAFLSGASTVSGITTGFSGQSTLFVIYPAYNFADPIVSSATFNGTTLAGLGFTTSGLIGTWSLTGTSETIQVVVGNPPAAAVPGPLPLLGIGAAFGWSRRLRKRIAAPLSTPPQA
jgi:MYXO-CTERM domain-containing protein